MSDITTDTGPADDPGNENPLGARLRALRQKRHLSLDQVAQASGVSRSTISKIELGQVVPGTAILAKLVETLGTSFAAIMSTESAGETVLLRSQDQPVMRDETTGFTRRCIAPILPSRGLDWVLNDLPPGQSTGTFVPHRIGVEEYIYVLSGRLHATLGQEDHVLEQGDALYFQAHIPHTFTAADTTACQYLLIIDNRT